MQKFICQSIHHVMLNNSIAIARNFMFMISTFSHPPMASVAKSSFLSGFLEGRKDPRADRCIVNFTEKVQTKKNSEPPYSWPIQNSQTKTGQPSESPTRSPSNQLSNPNCKQEGKSRQVSRSEMEIKRE